jgi:hypothetical protein
MIWETLSEPEIAPIQQTQQYGVIAKVSGYYCSWRNEVVELNIHYCTVIYV